MPKKFKFSLEALIKIKKLEEEQAIIELGKIISKINQEKEKVQKIEEQYQKELKNFKEMAQKTSFTAFYQSFQIFLNRMESQKKELEKFIVSMQPELEEKRNKLMEVRKNLKLLETLKEKKLAEYKKELKSIERKELFELNQRKLKKWENVKNEPVEETEILDEESSEDIRTRKERELKKYYRNKGLSG